MVDLKRKILDYPETRIYKPGDWIEMLFGFTRITFYILADTGDSILISTYTWLSTHPSIFKKADFTLYRHKNHPGLHSPVIYLGRTKRRWWWKYMPWRDLICPFKPLRKKDIEKNSFKRKIIYYEF